MTKDHLYLILPIISVVVTLNVMDHRPQAKVEQQLIVKPEILTGAKTEQTQYNGYNWNSLPVKSPSSVYRVNEKLDLSQKEIRCLAKNIFYEAGIEDFEGKIMVAQVTLNRTRDKRWGNTICSAVYSPAQFSWTLKKKLKNGEPHGELWIQSIYAAYEFAVNGVRIHGLEQALFYHTDYIDPPHWAPAMTAVAKIGKHIVYNES